jgi:hypothetical protein
MKSKLLEKADTAIIYTLAGITVVPLGAGIVILGIMMWLSSPIKNPPKVVLQKVRETISILWGNLKKYYSLR